MTRFTDVLDNTIEKLNCGEAIAFGKIQMTRKGIEVNGRRLSWKNLAEIDVSYGDSAPPVVIISQKGWQPNMQQEVWAMLSAHQVSNLPLLLMLVNEIGADSLPVSA